MPVVKEVIKHILRHVNAEAADSDPSQVAGVAARAQYVRDALSGFETDTRDLSLDATLEEISSAASLSVLQTSFKKAVTNMRDVGDTRPRLAIQAWVGKAREQRGG